jgi:uncharacterized membrane protein (DUF485 family)
MNTNEIKAVVDMVSDKISGGIQAVQPLAEEVVRQYQARELLQGVGSSIGFVISIVVAFAGLALSVKSAEKNCEVGVVIGGFGVVLGIICSVVFVIAAFASFGNYVAPLCGLIGK